MRPSTDAGPTTPGRRLVNGQIPTLANRLHISPSKIIRRANIGPTISTQRLGCSRWPSVGRTLACQLRRSTNHADHVPTLDQRFVADWDISYKNNLYLVYVYVRFVYNLNFMNKGSNDPPHVIL